MKTAFHSAPPPPRCSEEWEIRTIVGRKTVGGEVQYLVEWEPTWMRESDLTGARELIDEFMSLLPKRGQ
jgi:hypothetical protein